MTAGTMSATREQGGWLSVWCGWVLCAAAVLTPLVAWLGPLAFAPLMSLVGLLTFPAVRIGPRDAPLALVLALALTWVGLSMFWSPVRPHELEDMTGVKLALQAPLYWAAWSAARRADAVWAARAGRLFAWGLAACGALMFIEALTGGAVYLHLRELIGDPIRPDLGRRNLAQGSFALALLWPVAAVAGARSGASLWLAVPMAAGPALLAQLFLSDAPVLALGVVGLVGLAVWAWPRKAPNVLGAAAGAVVLLMPLLAAGVAGAGVRLPESWAQRVSYWGYAVERIAERPLAGWGLDASRAFSPHIQLHPHNGALQVWLELGLPGAVLLALVWAQTFRRLAREGRGLLAPATAGSAAVYLFFGLVSFGLWQEWWLALGALVAVIAGLAERREPPPIDARGLSE
jgi:O-antigen ligase